MNESGIYGEEVKLEGKVFDEYFEAYIDAHDEGERWRGLRMRCVELRCFGLWTILARFECPVHRIGAMELRTGRAIPLSTIRYKAQLKIRIRVALPSCCALLCERNAVGWL